MFLNEELQMHIFTFTSTFPLELGHSFTLDVKFQKCGGVITEPDNGVLSNLNFGEERLYLPNSSCQWLLQAPEGKIAKVSLKHIY
uniref:CUB domain-containing protein n=1 Tax=Heterorhabditis bacteriophora TaxID=37862 RepID=A0A1I7X934_HETBA